MTSTQNIKDCGWWCHAPNKPTARQDMALPPTSQIPGLSEFPEGYFQEEPIRPLHKATDTKYITLSKQGGRPDLLRMRTPPKRNDGPKPYSIHADWYYIEDNRKADEEEKLHEPTETYCTKLPDYMVHNDYNPYGHQGDSHPLSRNPMTRDTTTVFDREGRNATNKTMKIAEARPSGYGVRGEKHQNKPPAMPVMPKVQRGKAPESEMDQGKPKVRAMKVPKEEERPPMAKILSFGYQADWQNEHDKWQKQQEELMRKQHESVMHQTKQEKCQTEYQAQMAANGAQRTPQRTPQHGRRAPSGSSTASHRRQKAKNEKEAPAFFTLPSYNKPEVEPMQYNPATNLSSLSAGH